jgi:raffinose/stachyose/melibiose transport system permease protein
VLQYGSRQRNYVIYLLPGLIGLITLIVVPLAATIWFSFTQWTGIGHPKWIGLANWTKLLHDNLFWQSFEHTALLVIAGSFVPTILGLFLAAVLVDYIARFFGNRTASGLRAAFYLPQVVPLPVVGIMWLWILGSYNGALNLILKSAGLSSLAQDWLGDPHYALPSVMAVLIWGQIGFALIIFMAALSRVDPELYEAADIDGASWWQRSLKISFPLIRPEIVVVLVTTTIATLQVFGQVYVLTGGGPGYATYVPSYFAYLSYFIKADVGYGSAISLTEVALVIVLAVLFMSMQKSDSVTTTRTRPAWRPWRRTA